MLISILPLPGSRVTRAIELLRLPVARKRAPLSIFAGARLAARRRSPRRRQARPRGGLSPPPRLRAELSPRRSAPAPPARPRSAPGRRPGMTSFFFSSAFGLARLRAPPAAGASSTASSATAPRTARRPPRTARLLGNLLGRLARLSASAAGGAMRDSPRSGGASSATGLRGCVLVLRRLVLRRLRLLVVHQVQSVSIGFGCCAACGWSGPAYTFSLVSCWRARRLRGSIPLTALRITSSGLRSSISPSVRDLIPPG